MKSRRDYRSNNRGAVFDRIEEDGIRTCSNYNSQEIDENENDRALGELQDRVNVLKKLNVMDASKGMLSGTMDRFKMVFETKSHHNYFKHVLPKDPKSQSASSPKDDIIGILSFEVANAMSKTIQLHKSLSETEISALHNDVLKSHAIRTLVSTDESYLLELVLAEKLDDLNSVAALVSRLGKRCTEQALLGFEHVYTDLLKGRIEIGKLRFLIKDMDRTIRKMERYVSSTASLYGELGVLNELEQGVKKSHLAQYHEETRQAFRQKIQWQHHDVRHLRETSLWNQTYDKIVGLMARVVCTIYDRIHVVFGNSALIPHYSPDESRQLSRKFVPNHNCLPVSGSLYTEVSDRKSGWVQPKRPVVNMSDDNLRFPCGASPGRIFMGCLSSSSSTSWEDGDEHFESENHMSQSPISLSSNGEQKQSRFGRCGLFQFGPKSRVTMYAAHSTLGGSSLALHYSNIIIIIEKFLRYPHLVGEEARDDLYQMLPMSLRLSLRKSLKSYVKNLAIYDAPLAHDWRLTLDNLLTWLAPMAHNMIRWQTEQNFEQQRIVLKTNILLLQTLYFADKEKTEAEICKLLVGLNYICRYEHQRTALLDCSSSVDFDECVDWQL